MTDDSTFDFHANQATNDKVNGKLRNSKPKIILAAVESTVIFIDQSRGYTIYCPILRDLTQ